MLWNKDEKAYPVTCSKEFGQNTMQQFNLSRCPNKFVIDISAGTDLILHTFK